MQGGFWMVEPVLLATRKMIIEIEYMVMSKGCFIESHIIQVQR